MAEKGVGDDASLLRTSSYSDAVNVTRRGADERTGGGDGGGGGGGRRGGGGPGAAASSSSESSSTPGNGGGSHSAAATSSDERSAPMQVAQPPGSLEATRAGGAATGIATGQQAEKVAQRKTNNDEEDDGRDDKDAIEPRGEVSPYDTAGIWSKISYGFVLPLLRLGWKRPIQVPDLPPLRNDDRADTVSERLEAAWLALGEKRFTWKRPMWWAIYHAYKGIFYYSALLTVSKQLGARLSSVGWSVVGAL